jgi:UDP-glucose 4-epimerase
MKILVLGGRGFLGRHLVELLVREGHSVRIFGRRGSRPQGGTPDFSLRVEVVEGDFGSGCGLSEALEGVELVYHLLSTTVPSDSDANPIGDVSSNLLGTLRLLGLMEVQHVRRIVFASSGGTVYGNPIMLPVSEDHPLEPICSYGVVKVAIENYLTLHCKRKGLVANVLRISNPYGAYQNRIGSQGVISTFLHRLVNDKPIEIWGDGSAVRDYVYVSDVARALLLAGLRKQSATFNIGSGVGHSINEILRVLKTQTGLAGTIRYLPHRGFDVDQTYLDISRARRELGWQPEFSLEAGCLHYCEQLGVATRELAVN